MERSQELLDFFTAIPQGGPIAPYLSASPDIVSIGTGPDEWITGRDTIVRVFEAEQTQDAERHAEQIHSNPQAWAEGDVGWVIDRPIYRLPGGREAQMRTTIIFHREDGAWKALHMHTSLGVPNEQVPAFSGDE